MAASLLDAVSGIIIGVPSSNEGAIGLYRQVLGGSRVCDQLQMGKVSDTEGEGFVLCRMLPWT